MGYKFNPFTSTFDYFEAGSSTTWLAPVADEASLPLTDVDGAARVILDQDVVYVFDVGSSKWHRTRITSGAFQAAANAAGISLNTVTTGNIVTSELRLHPADATNPGGVSTSSQTFSGDKTFQNNVVIQGDLTVNGSTTTVNTATLDVEDTNITVNKNGDDISAEGAGLTIERSGTFGSLVYENALVSKFKAGALGSEVELANVSSSQALTNKTINADLNSISNIDNSEIKALAGIDATKISTGSVTNNEFDYLDGVTAPLQTQIDNRFYRIQEDVDQEFSISLSNNIGSFTDITGLAFSNGFTRSALLHYSIYLEATSSLYECGELRVVQKGSSWEIQQSSLGDNSEILFDITSTGQLQYKSSNYPGFIDCLLKVRGLTTGI